MKKLFETYVPWTSFLILADNVIVMWIRLRKIRGLISKGSEKSNIFMNLIGTC